MSGSGWQPGDLRISLWDFSWYTQTAPGEPFHDLAVAFDELVDRGYTAVRICAAPLLLFGDHDIPTGDLEFVEMAPGVGVRTRWYSVVGGARLDLRARLFELFRLARDRGVRVIISSWEYQQSPAFLAGPEWWELVSAIPPAERHLALARAESRMLDALADAGLGEQVAYVEIHNEVDLSRLRDVAGPDENTFWAQKPYLERALDLLQTEHPDVLSTACYGIPPWLDLDSMPRNAQVAHQHFYVYGVLAALEAWAGVRAAPPEFPSARLRSLLRDDAPDFDAWRADIAPWRLEATGISPSMFYAYDWVDPSRWDAWLYDHWQEHALAMQQAIDDRLEAVAIWAAHRGIPAVIGEGWIGYTPLEADFEDGPVGRAFAEHAVRRCRELGYWGTIVGSNSAPQHPAAWRNRDLQRRLNGIFAGVGSDVDAQGGRG